MAYETLHSLFPSLLLGNFPEWPEHTRVSAGEELRELLQDGVAQAESDDADLERIRQILIDFGALEKDDYSTGIADLIEALLPPANGD